jgi:hypothetical protein
LALSDKIQPKFAILAEFGGFFEFFPIRTSILQISRPGIDVRGFANILNALTFCNYLGFRVSFSAGWSGGGPAGPEARRIARNKEMQKWNPKPQKPSFGNWPGMTWTARTSLWEPGRKLSAFARKRDSACLPATGLLRPTW